MLSEYYEENNIETGDISPEQSQEWDKLIKKISALLCTLVVQNTPSLGFGYFQNIIKTSNIQDYKQYSLGENIMLSYSQQWFLEILVGINLEEELYTETECDLMELINAAIVLNNFDLSVLAYVDNDGVVYEDGELDLKYFSDVLENIEESLLSEGVDNIMPHTKKWARFNLLIADNMLKENELNITSDMAIKALRVREEWALYSKAISKLKSKTKFLIDQGYITEN